MILELTSLAVAVAALGYALGVRRQLSHLSAYFPSVQSSVLLKKDAETLLPNVVAARFGQDSVLWAIIGSFWAANAVLLVALGATGNWAASPSLVRVICSTGLFVSFVWLIMQAAALRRVIYYEALTTSLEEAMGVPEPMRLFGRHPEASARGAPLLPPARSVMPLAPIVALVAWAVGSYLAFWG